MHATQPRAYFVQQQSGKMPPVDNMRPEMGVLGMTGGRPSQSGCGGGAGRDQEVVDESGGQGAGHGGCRRQRARAAAIAAPLHLRRGQNHHQHIPGRRGRGRAHRLLGVRRQAAVRMPFCLSSAVAARPAVLCIKQYFCRVLSGLQASSSPWPTQSGPVAEIICGAKPCLLWLWCVSCSCAWLAGAC